MKTAREVAHEAMGCGTPVDDEIHMDRCNRLTTAIEQVQRETVEACAQLCLVDANAHWKGAEQAESEGDYDGAEVANDIASGLMELAKRIRSLSPKGGQGRTPLLARCGHIAYHGDPDVCTEDRCPCAAYLIAAPTPPSESRGDE